jgi:hypothetical protein
MKKSLILTIAGAVAIATLGTTAFAENTIDKGELGKYVRQGRFVKPVLTPSPRTEAPAIHAKDKAFVDKGDLGKYERQGRLLKPVLTPSPRSNAPAPRVAPAPNVTNDHRLNGKLRTNIGRKRAYQ